MADPETSLDPRYSESDAEPSSWERSLELLRSAELFWIASVRDDGRPHLTPLVAVWLDDALYFTTGAEEQKALNIAQNPQVVLLTGRNDWDQGLDLSVEGEAVRETDELRLTQLAGLWSQKWDGRWRFQIGDGRFQHPEGGSALVFRVRPAKVLAFAKGHFGHTRHRFKH